MPIQILGWETDRTLRHGSCSGERSQQLPFSFYMTDTPIIDSQDTTFDGTWPVFQGGGLYHTLLLFRRQKMFRWISVRGKKNLSHVPFLLILTILWPRWLIVTFPKETFEREETALLLWNKMKLVPGALKPLIVWLLLFHTMELFSYFG